ncbi:MAG: hypothetical protein V4524_02100 [Patescibacteria group bacterium]
MVNQQLLEYITYQLDHGMSPMDLERKLKAEGGWNHDDVKGAFLALNLSPTPDPVTTPPAPAPASRPAFTPTQAPIVSPTAPMPVTLTPAPVVPGAIIQETVIAPPPQPQSIPAPKWELPPREKPPASSFSQPSFSASPLPPTSASRVFVAPARQQYQQVRHSGMRTVIILFIIIVLLGGAGGYVYLYQPDMVQQVIGKFAQSTKNTNSSVTAPTKVTSPLKNNIVNNSLYTFTVPVGWKTVLVANDGRGVQASNSMAGYIVSVAVTPIPQSSEKITSADQIITSDNVSTIIKSEFAGAVLGKVSSGTLGGEKAVIVAFTIPATTTGSEASSSAKEAILQYSAVHGDALYSVVFKSSLDKGLSLLKDAEGIVTSFAFK